VLFPFASVGLFSLRAIRIVTGPGAWRGRVGSCLPAALIESSTCIQNILMQLFDPPGIVSLTALDAL